MTLPGMAAQRQTGRRLAALGLCALLILVFFVPVFSWIRVVNTEALYDVMKLKSSVVKKLAQDY